MLSTLYEERFQRIPLTGRLMRRQLQKRAAAMVHLTSGMQDPDVSIIIRSRNDGTFIKQLFEDIRNQDFTGKIDIIVVDTESTDDTLPVAHAEGARIIHLTQAEFTYPRALNVAFHAARHPYVVTLVGHSNLTNRYMLKSLTYWSSQHHFGGMYSMPLANRNGSFWERINSSWMPFILAKPYVLKRPAPGMLGANCSIVKRDVWEKLGGYDERYAGGGEDAALARSMLEAGFTIVREPLCSVFHAHSLGFVNVVRQLRHWAEVGRPIPQPFDTAKIHARRPDLRSPDNA